MPDDITGRQQEDVALTELEARADARAVEVAPRKEPATPLEWVRDNLFSSWFNGILTVLAGSLAVYLVYGMIHWVFVSAEWGVVKANLSSYMLARFPRDEVTRVWIALYLVVGLWGLTWGYQQRPIHWTVRRVVLAVALSAAGALALVYMLEGLRIWLLIGAAAVLFLGAYRVGKAFGKRLRALVVTAWILVYPVVVLTLVAFGGPSARAWGGLLLNIMVGSVGIVASFPIGVLLALGRRSTFPAIRTFCVGFIEFVRGVPLITLLLFAVFILPLLLPPGLNLPIIVRAMIMVTIFSSVYVAEIVRGGLQGVHHGQYEAGKALGLPTWRMTSLVILPQALRNTIPAMISHFISLWKDTSLLAIIAGFTDLLRTARRAGQSLEFFGHQAEALVAAAVIFWAIALSLGRWSQRVEKRVGVGER